MKKINGFGVALVAALGMALAGCSGSGDTASAQAMPASVQGTVHGGQSPIVGATVTLYAVSDTAQSSAATVATTTTDGNGNFNYSFTCPDPSAQMYVTATGGNPGGGANSAIHLMTILGQCQSLHRSATVNELTTIAAAYTANRFIGPAGCADCGGGLPASVDNISGPAPGLPNAMGNAATLADPVAGTAGATLPSAAACAAANPPSNCMTLRKLNTLGNALAACVNSTGPTSSQCTQLFQCATVGAAWASSTSCSVPAGAAQPTDTLQAILNVARNPAKISPTGLDYTSTHNTVFSPGITAHPTDETLAVNFSSGGINGSCFVAIDAAGNAWITESSINKVVALSPNGTPLPGSPFNGGGTLSDPFGIAIDANGEIWVGNEVGNSLTKLAPGGGYMANYNGGGLDEPLAVAVDTNGSIWLANYGNNSVSEFSSAGAALSGTTGFTGGGSVFNGPFGLAIDAAGDAWISNSSTGSTTANAVTELNTNGVLYAGMPVGSSAISEPDGIAIDSHGDAWVTGYASSTVAEFSPSGALLSGTNGYTGGGLSNPRGIAFDSAGNAWIANFNNITELSPGGAALSPSQGFLGPGQQYGEGIAIDPSGNVWSTNAIFLTNSTPSGVTVFFGAAAPTRTPLVATLSQGFAP
jgi:hypothetical protein